MRRRDLLALFLASLTGEAGAQDGRMPRLAVLSPTSKTGGHSGFVYEPFVAALANLGWIAGRNIEIIERFADDQHERLPALAAELVALRPDVIFTNTGNGARAAAEATRTIPIPVVVSPAGEALFAELAVNFARPAGNVTGMTLHSQGQDEKCLELLKEAVPSAVRVGVLVNPLNPNFRDYPASLQSAGDALGLVLIRMEARSADEIDAAFGDMAGARDIQGLHVPDDSTIAGRPRSRRRIVEITSTMKVPVVSTHLAFVPDGGLLALGTDIPALARRGADYVDRILKGAKPADLPVERPRAVKLVVNVRAARGIGLTLSPFLLARADEVIE